MKVAPVLSVEDSKNQSQPGMHFLREVLPTVVREVGCQARAGECEEACPCSLCRVMFTFESNAITIADLLFSGQQFFGTRPVARSMREHADAATFAECSCSFVQGCGGSGEAENARRRGRDALYVLQVPYRSEEEMKSDGRCGSTNWQSNIGMFYKLILFTTRIFSCQSSCRSCTTL
jgi:hypothetical protein